MILFYYICFFEKKKKQKKKMCELSVDRRNSSRKGVSDGYFQKEDVKAYFEQKKARSSRVLTKKTMGLNYR